MPRLFLLFIFLVCFVRPIAGNARPIGSQFSLPLPDGDVGIYRLGIRLNHPDPSTHQKVSLIHMIHLGPPSGFSDIFDFHRSVGDRHRRQIFFLEGVGDARGFRYQWASEAIQALSIGARHAFFDEICRFGQTEDAAIIKVWLSKGLLRKVTVEGEVLSLAGTYQSVAQRYGIELQSWDRILPPNAVRETIDMNMEDLSLSDQVIMDLASACFTDHDSCLDPNVSDRVRKWNLEPIIEEMREQKVIAALKEVFLQKTDAEFYLPWGGNHLSSFFDALVDMGYTVDRIYPILYATCREVFTDMNLAKALEEMGLQVLEQCLKSSWTARDLAEALNLWTGVPMDDAVLAKCCLCRGDRFWKLPFNRSKQIHITKLFRNQGESYCESLNDSHYQAIPDDLHPVSTNFEFSQNQQKVQRARIYRLQQCREVELERCSIPGH